MQAAAFAQIFQQLVESNRAIAQGIQQQALAAQQQQEQHATEMEAVRNAFAGAANRHTGVVDVWQVGKPVS